MVTCPHCGKEFMQPKLKTAAYSDAFEEFWVIYQARKRTPSASKPDAQKAWDQMAGERPDLHILLEAVKRYLTHLDETATTPCHPATWLRQERWGGFIPTVVKEETKRVVIAHPSWPKDIVEAMAKRIGPTRFQTWLGSNEFRAGPPPAIVVTTGFRRDYIRDKLAEEIYYILGRFVILLEP